MTDIVEYPEWVMLRDTMLHDDMGGLGQRIYTSAGSGYTKQKYIRADVVESLRQQLADAYNREANARCSHCGGVFFETDLSKQLAEANETLKNHGEIQADLCRQLAECQAREKLLLDALEGIAEIDLNNSWSCQSGMAKEALAIPSDSTALDTMKRQWQREAFKAGYARGHDDTVEGRYNQTCECENECADEWMTEELE